MKNTRFVFMKRWFILREYFFYFYFNSDFPAIYINKKVRNFLFWETLFQFTDNPKIYRVCPRIYRLRSKIYRPRPRIYRVRPKIYWVFPHFTDDNSTITKEKTAKGENNAEQSLTAQEAITTWRAVWMHTTDGEKTKSRVTMLHKFLWDPSVPVDKTMMTAHLSDTIGRGYQQSTMIFQDVTFTNFTNPSQRVTTKYWNLIAFSIVTGLWNPHRFVNGVV